MKMRTVFAGIYALVILFAVCGCHSEPETSAPSFPPDNLMGDALKTYNSYWKAVHEGNEESRDEIPSTYWAERIKALNPVRVYTHRVNVVVVQRISDGIEEGKYIYIPISSYIPMEGIDGFECRPVPPIENSPGLNDGVYDYKRTIIE